MIIDKNDQYSDAWFKLRLGLPTSSKFGQIITPGGLYSKSADKYMNELIGERMTNRVERGFVSDAMTAGLLQEEHARTWFERAYQLQVDQVGLILDDDATMGCSPDGLVHGRTGLEIKCPQAHTMVKYLLDDKMPRIYYPQIQGSLMITGFAQWYLLIYHESFKPILWVVSRDDSYIDKMRVCFDEFFEMMDLKMKCMGL